MFHFTRSHAWKVCCAAALTLAAGPCLAHKAPPESARGSSPARAYVLEPQSGLVSQYRIGAGGLLRPLTPASVSAGKFSICIAAAPRHHAVYVGRLSSFTRLQGTLSTYTAGPGGRLRAAGLPVNIPAPSSLAATADGRFLYVACQQVSSGKILEYRIGRRGALTPLAPRSVPLADDPWSVVISPGGKFLYAVEDAGVFQFQIGRSGRLTALPSAAVQTALACRLYFSPDGHDAYIISQTFTGPALQGTSSAQILSAYKQTKARTEIGLYRVDSQGRLSRVSTPMLTVPGAVYDVAFSPDGRSAYVADPDAQILLQYSLDAGGAFHPRGTTRIDVPGGPQSLAVDAARSLLYVTSHQGGHVWAYGIDKSGALSPRPTSAARPGEGATGMVITER